MRRSIAQEDRSALFERLFREQYQAVAAYIARRAEPPLVDDLVDEVFLVLWQRLEDAPEEPRAWLLGVARNVLGTHIRGARRRRALGVRLAVNQRDPVVSSPTVQGDVLVALASLKPDDREALLLVSWDGLTPDEAARALGQRPGSFRVRLHRARARFRSALESQEGQIDAGPAGPVTKEVANA
jgi:RNA polymerase sigma-70 factor (ECF subfamily)